MCNGQLDECDQFSESSYHTPKPKTYIHQTRILIQQFQNTVKVSVYLVASQTFPTLFSNDIFAQLRLRVYMKCPPFKEASRVVVLDSPNFWVFLRTEALEEVLGLVGETSITSCSSSNVPYRAYLSLFFFLASTGNTAGCQILSPPRLLYFRQPCGTVKEDRSALSPGHANQFHLMFTCLFMLLRHHYQNDLACNFWSY